jgi:thermitase
MRSRRFLLPVIIAVLSLLILPLGVLAGPDSGDSAPVDHSSGEIIVKFATSASPADIAQIHRQNRGQVKQRITAIGAQVVAVGQGQVMKNVRAYSANPKVAYAEPNYLCQVIGDPDDQYFGRQWGMSKVEAPQAWDVTTGSSGTNIAILDTGVDEDHPDLAGKVVTNANFSNSSTPDDRYGHGTHVAGIAAASTNNGIGVAGLGHDATIMNVKVLDDNGSGYYSWVANGIIWAADNGAEVINLSLGGRSYSQILEDAVKYAWSKGVVIVASAGNSGNSVPNYPAYLSDCLAVAATDINDQLPYWSSRGDWVDIAAPGMSIYSSLRYGYMSGTSMAAPHAAGLAGLIFTMVTDENANGLLNDEVRARIEATADDIGVPGTGTGRINALRAVTAAPVPTGEISGQVTDADTGSPLAGALVSDGSRSAVSDAGGQYTLLNVPEGNRTVTASKFGYESQSSSTTVTAGQTAHADFTLNAAVPTTGAMWADSIGFSPKGKNLFLNVAVSCDRGAVAGARLGLTLEWNGQQTWTYSGITDQAGTVRFKLGKPPGGDYVATLSSLTCDGYTWDRGSGVTSASYTFSRQTRKTR